MKKCILINNYIHQLKSEIMFMGFKLDKLFVYYCVLNYVISADFRSQTYVRTLAQTQVPILSSHCHTKQYCVQG